MHDPPPSVYESWPAPNHVDPVTRGNGITITTSVLLSLTILVVGARCYTRVWITGSFGLDDVFILAAMVPCICLAGATIASYVYCGWDRHVWDATPRGIYVGLILEFASAILYIWASAFTKLSVMYFCKRLLSPSHPKWFKPALNIFAIMTVTGNLSYTMIFCLSCQPLSGYWDHFPPAWAPTYHYKCLDIPLLWLGGSILNCLWDVMTWAVPLPIIYQLHLPMKQRMAVMALFGVGACVIIASVLKTVYIEQAFVQSYDFTWLGYPLWICGTVEVDLGILCASAPALRPLFSHILPRQNPFAGHRSYAEMSRGRDGPRSNDTPMKPVAAAHRRFNSTTSSEDMKPWSRRPSRNASREPASRKGSLTKSVTDASDSSVTDTTPTSTTFTPGSPVTKARLTPVREIEPVSGIFNEHCTPNFSDSMPPPVPDDRRSDYSFGAFTAGSDSRRTSPYYLWRRSTSRPGSRGRKPSLGSEGASRDRSTSQKKYESGTVTNEALPSAAELPALSIYTNIQRDVQHRPSETVSPLSGSEVSPCDSQTGKQSYKARADRQLKAFQFDVPASKPNVIVASDTMQSAHMPRYL